MSHQLCPAKPTARAMDMECGICTGNLQELGGGIELPCRCKVPYCPRAGASTFWQVPDLSLFGDSESSASLRLDEMARAACVTRAFRVAIQTSALTTRHLCVCFLLVRRGQQCWDRTLAASLSKAWRDRTEL